MALHREKARDFFFSFRLIKFNFEYIERTDHFLLVAHFKGTSGLIVPWQYEGVLKYGRNLDLIYTSAYYVAICFWYCLSIGNICKCYFHHEQICAQKTLQRCMCTYKYYIYILYIYAYIDTKY